VPQNEKKIIVRNFFSFLLLLLSVGTVIAPNLLCLIFGASSLLLSLIALTKVIALPTIVIIEKKQ